MNKIKIFYPIIVLILICAGSTSKAALIFFDDFDSYSEGVPWPGEGNWTVTEASVDLIGAGTSWDLLPGNGKYVDMDGTLASPNAGTIESISIALAPGDYVLSFDIAGNQRNGADDAVNVAVSGGLLNASITSISAGLPFTTISMPFTVSTGTSATISFDGQGGDNVGALLDNVALNSVDGKIPAPGAIMLGSIGVGIVGWLHRRKIV